MIAVRSQRHIATALAGRRLRVDVDIARAASSVTTSGHPLLDGPSAPIVGGVLPRRERLLTLLSGNAAAGNIRMMKADWAALKSEDHDVAVELVLQNTLFCGFARTINALSVIHSLGYDTKRPLAARSENSLESRREAGEALCSKIYGSVYPKLRQRLVDVHPEIDAYMIEMGYGGLLSRPGPTVRERELCVIAVLAGQIGTSAQLISHVRGAMLVGATLEECKDVLDQTATVWGEQEAEEVSRVFAENFG